jgi:hypothetical protein
MPGATRDGTYLGFERMHFGQYVRYEAVADEFRNLPGLATVRLLAAIQWLLRNDQSGGSADDQLAVLKLFADPLLARKAEAWLRTHRAQRVHHRCTIPAMMQIALLETTGTPDALQPGQLATLMSLSIKTNDLLEPDYQPVRASTNAEVYRNLGASFFRNGFYSHSAQWGAATARNWAIATEGMAAVQRRFPSEWFDASGTFRSLTGLSTSDWMLGAAALVAHYDQLTREQFNKDPRCFAVGLGFVDGVAEPELAARVRIVLSMLSDTWSGHGAAMASKVGAKTSNVQQFFSIYDRPLMRVDDVFFPLDTAFLRAQTAEGWYWRLVAELRAAGRGADVPRLHSATGRSFEWYCSDLVTETLKRGGTFGAWRDWEGEIKSRQGQSLPDMVLVSNGTAFVVEITSAAVPPAKAVCGDADELEESLCAVWFGQSPKLLQLQSACEGLEEGKIILKGYDQSAIRRVQPLLVSLRYVPLHLATWNWFKDIMRKRGLSDAFVERIRIMDAEDWEEFCEAGRSEIGLAGAFDGWQGSTDRWVSFEDWRAVTVGKRDVHPRVSEHIDAFWKAGPGRLEDAGTTGQKGG